MSEAILFTRCLGLNDAGRQSTAVSNPSPRSKEPGATELVDCLNVTTTEDGALESIPALTTVLTHSAPVLALSAGKRFLYQSATETKEWDGTNVSARFPLKTGAMCHTPIDCRVGLFKSPDSTLTMQAATVGTNPNPATSRTFSAMPAYSRAFAFNGRLYAVNAADPRFLQHSEPYHFDLWNYGDGFHGDALPILDADVIHPTKQDTTGVILWMHATGVTVLTGTGPHDFTKKFYACRPLLGTLFSGFISEALTSGHVFLAADGVYFVDSTGALDNLTGNQLNHLDTLNASYAAAVVDGGKYLALGNAVGIEYNFVTKAVTKRAPQSIAAATLWNNTAYFAVGSLIQKQSGTSDLPTLVTLPSSDWGAPKQKRIDSFFFTGTIEGPATLTATSNQGEWSIDLPEMQQVYNHRIKAPRVELGNSISVSIATTAGAFRLEQLRATFTPMQRTQ